MVDHVGRELEVNEIVLQVLAEEVTTRNSDKLLLLKVWFKMGWNSNVPFEDLEKISSPESITRCRRQIQNDSNNPRFLPTDPKVIAARGIKEEQLRAYYGGRRDDIINEYIYRKYGVQ